MEGQKPYAQFAKLSPEKQASIVQQQTQGEPKQLVADLSKQFPEMNFIELYGTQNKKAIKLANYRYAPTNDVKGVVVAIHSMNLYTGVFVQLGKTLASNGFVLTGFDLRGHGRSQGQRGYLDDSKQILKDCQNYLKQIVKAYPNKPIYLLGHGSGAMLSIIYSKQTKIPIAGLILTSPALKQPGNSKVLSAISGVALKMMPNKAGLFQPNYENMFKNPNASKFIKEDKYVHHQKVVVGTLTQMMAFMKKNEQDSWVKLQTPPVLFIQGQYDKIADPQNTIKFYQQIKTVDKTLQWFPKMWGGFFLQEQYPQVESTILKWLSARCK